MTSVSAGHIILTTTQPGGSGRPSPDFNLFHPCIIKYQHKTWIVFALERWIMIGYKKYNSFILFWFVLIFVFAVIDYDIFALS